MSKFIRVIERVLAIILVSFIVFVCGYYVILPGLNWSVLAKTLIVLVGLLSAVLLVILVYELFNKNGE